MFAAPIGFGLVAAPGALREILLFVAMGFCLSIVALIAFASRRGKLHIPGYLFLALFSFVISIALGKLSGSRHFAGTAIGFLFSIIFFSLIAISVGSILALFLYRRPNA